MTLEVSFLAPATAETLVEYIKSIVNFNLLAIEWNPEEHELASPHTKWRTAQEINVYGQLFNLRCLINLTI